MKKTYVIPRKQSGTGSIHDIASEHYDREIVFAPGCKYAVVLASYYNGDEYTSHKTEGAAIKASNSKKEWSHKIIDFEGNEYDIYNDSLVRRN